MSDPRVSKVDDFTSTSHSKPSPSIDPSKVRLITPFVICIIGASRGIGEGVALSYAKAGCSGLVLAARSADQLQNVAENVKQINPKIQTEVYECDITGAKDVEKLSKNVTKVFGRLDVLVVNSGFSGEVELKITDGDPEDWQRAFNVNAIGTYHAAHYFIPLLLSSPHGAKAFIAVGSIASCIRRGIIANSKYCISKMAQARIVEHIAEQFGEEGMLSVAVHPGAVGTKMAESAPEAFRRFLVDDHELCGSFCVWLTKEPGEVSWLNGRLISANWDPEELIAKKAEVLSRDLLKFEVSTS